MSEKSPFSSLALEEHAPLTTEFLTRSKCLTPKEVESKLFHRRSCYKKILPHPNKEVTGLKGCAFTLGMGPSRMQLHLGSLGSQSINSGYREQFGGIHLKRSPRIKYVVLFMADES